MKHPTRGHLDPKRDPGQDPRRAIQMVALLFLLPLIFASRTPVGAETIVNVPGQGPSWATPQGWEVTLSNGETLMTHGPDASPSCLASLCTLLTGTKESITCVADGEERFELIYARAADDVDRSLVMIPLLRQGLYDASAFIDSEAASVAATARARLKVRCGDSAEATVATAVLPTSKSAETFSTIVSDLKALGFNSTTAKYMIFYDDCTDPCYGGQGNIRSDDRASSRNFNNTGPSYGIDYDYLEAGPDWQTLLHEASHNMGAVQLSAPNTSGSGGWHCNDGRDIMCYADGGASSNYSATACTTVRFDCNLDDYFHPAPVAGTYLANHWNLAAPYNSYIDHD